MGEEEIIQKLASSNGFQNKNKKRKKKANLKNCRQITRQQLFMKEEEIIQKLASSNGFQNNERSKATKTNEKQKAKTKFLWSQI